MQMQKLVATAAVWLVAGSSLFGQSKPAPNVLRRPGETTVFSFTTSRGKTVSLCEGPEGAYLVYRFGTAAKTELQYPAVLDTSSWRKFTYFVAHRGGGTGETSGEIHQLSFMNGSILYVLDDLTYSSLNKNQKESNRREVSISVTVNDKTLSIAGEDATACGDLVLEDERLKRVPDDMWR